MDFAGSDSLLKSKQYENAPDLQMYPAVAAAVVPVYNIPELVAEKVTAPLVLSREVLAKIFMGDVHSWDDPAIVDDQDSEAVKDVLENKLVKKDITVVVRDDGSGTSEIFTKALSQEVKSSFILWCIEAVSDGFVEVNELSHRFAKVLKHLFGE